MAQDLSHTNARDLIPADALAHVPGWDERGSTAVLRCLDGGSVNTTFLVQTGAGRFVVRVHDAAATCLGVDRDREALLQAAASAAGLAPALVHVDPQRRFFIAEYVGGDAWRTEDFGRADRLRELAARLRELHTLPPPACAPFDLLTVLRGHAWSIADAEPRERDWVDHLLSRAELAMRETRSELRAPTIVHNDLHHSNIVGTGSAIRLLDWEYAAVADPLFDIACILAYYPQASAYAAELLDAAGLARHVSADMLASASWLFVLVSYFWYRRRRLAGPVEPWELDAEQALLRRLQVAQGQALR